MGEKISRRDYVKYLGAGAAGLAVGGAAGYLMAPEKVVTETVEKEVLIYGPIAQICVDRVKAMIEAGEVPADAVLRLLHVTGSRAQLEAGIDVWKEATGIDVELVTQGVEGDIFTKLIEESITKTGVYDVATIFSTWMGDLVESGVVRDVSEHYSAYGPNTICPSIEPLGTYVSKYKGKWYGLPLDVDVFTLTYRKDLFTEYKDEFEAQYGYELKPPDTWDQTLDIAKFFTELGLTSPEGDPVYGAYFYAEPEFAAYIGWWTIFTTMGGILFDPRNMDPLIDGPEGIAALNKFLEFVPYMPPEAVTPGWADLYDRYIKGQVVMTSAWPSLNKMAEEEGAYTKGKSGSAILPGSYVDVAGESKLTRAAPNPVNWVGLVSNYSNYPELGYLFWQFISSPSVGAEMILGGVILDIFRDCWFTNPYYKKQFQVLYVPEFMDALLGSIELSYPDPIMAGAYEYTGKLTTNVNAAMAGTKDPETALSDTAADWDGINATYGVDEQLEVWRALVELYPEHLKEIWRARGLL